MANACMGTRRHDEAYDATCFFRLGCPVSKSRARHC
jgi:hypothetical protein